MRIANGYTFFFGETECFSNWFVSPFTLEGITFPTNEHWMMFKKAQLFNDAKSMDAVLASKTPREAKAIGRLVQNFSPSQWASKCDDIVMRGARKKFENNFVILKDLLLTEGTVLVEASPYDRIWGVGLGQDDTKILDPKNWQGSNKLGNILTTLRDKFLTETDYSWVKDMKLPMTQRDIVKQVCVDFELTGTAEEDILRWLNEKNLKFTEDHRGIVINEVPNESI